MTPSLPCASRKVSLSFIRSIVLLIDGIVIVIDFVLIEEEALQRAEHARRQITAQRDEQERVRPPPT